MIDNLTFPNIDPAQKNFFKIIVSQVENYFLFNDFEFVITNKVNQISKKGKNVIVFLSGNEQFNIPVYTNDVGLIFTDFYKSNCNVNNIVPFPLGYRNDFIRQKHIPIGKRTTNLFFSGHIHASASRNNFKINVEKIKNNINNILINYTVQNGKGITTPQYLEIMRNSKFSLTPIGNIGHDTFRYFEAILCGSIPILCGQDFDIWYYKDNDGCVKLNTWNDLTPQLINNIILKEDFYYKKLMNFYESKLCNNALVNFAINKIKKHYET